MRRRAGFRPPVFGSAIGLTMIAAAVLLLLLPTGGGKAGALLVPHLVLLPVYYFTLRPVEGVGPVGAFAGGLSIDVLNAGPLGVTAAGLLVVHLMLHRERDALLALPAVFRLSGFALAAGFVLAISWVSMAVLGPGNWPGPVEVALAFAGLLAIAAGVELAMVTVGFARSGFGLSGLIRRIVKRKRHRRRSKRQPGSGGGKINLRRGFEAQRSHMGRQR